VADARDGEERVTKRSPWADLLRTAGQQLLPVVLTAGSLIGFVAFAGSVIVWTRFSAAKVPADQAVNVVPRDELVAIGSSLLLLFGFFGALAVIAVFLIDRGGRATPGMSRGLLLLLLIEGATAILAIHGGPELRRLLAAELFVLAVGVALWATVAAPFIQLDEEVPDRESDELDAEIEERPFRTKEGDFPVGPVAVIFAMVAAVDLPLLAAGATLLVDGSPLLSAVVGLAALLTVLGLAVLCQWINFHRDPERRREAREAQEKREEEEAERQGELAPVVRGLKWAGLELGAGEDDEEPRRKPPRLRLTADGMVLMAAVLATAVAGPSLVLGTWWILAALASAVALTAGLWRIADLAAARFMWYGLAVFISVPLFGTLMLMARNIDDPQVQPVALIRNTDGPDEAIQGLYVTETDERVYFATVATEGCSNTLAPHSGRLLWVPRSELVAMSIGPLQDVKDAGNTALEMAYALTPNVENPGGGQAGLTVAGKGSSPKPQPAASSLDKRLENVGAAVRPNFGAGWSLSPEDATPGEVVTLRISAPNRREGVEGFGSVREGRTLRIGGERVDVLKERARSPWDAEYVETGGGKTLRLEKQTVYERPGEGRLVAVDEPGEASRRGRSGKRDEMFVKLADKSVRMVRHRHGDSGMYLALGPQGQFAQLATGSPVAVLKNGHETGLESKLLRQAWHSDHIRFRVPEDARSGPVTVECAQLAGQPLLRVSHPPTARIAVRMRAGSERVTFDSGLSGDEDGKLASRRWSIDGIRRGRAKTVAEDMPPRRAAYTVRLAVTDSEGQVDTAEVRMLRLLPAQLGLAAASASSAQGGSAGVQHARERLMKAVEREPSSEIEIDAHQARAGETARENLDQSLETAELVDDQVLTANQPAPFPAGGVPVKEYAYGESCPPLWRSAERRRIDIFVLGEGARVAPPRGCHPGRLQTGRW
jgi:hypothetical protein